MIQRCWNNIKYLDGAGPSPRNIERLDLCAVPMINFMRSTGLQVDLSHFAKMEIELVRDMDKLTEDVHDITGEYCNLDSGDQVSELLFKKLKLKQARPKMTKSDSRESVEDEVLTAIQHDHPVVPKIMDFKELSKLLGTYVRPMPKLARKVAFGKWRMFPNLGHTRIPSGRLNCNKPNLLAMPTRTQRGTDIRKGFITDEGWCFLSVDECLHPDTLIKTLVGDKKISDLEVGEPILTYREGKIKWGTVTRTSVIRPKLAYKLTFDNGESVIASIDHNWPTQTKIKKGRTSEIVIKTTGKLKIGERMVPCREGSNGAGYKTWYSKSAFLYDFQHTLIAEAYHGPRLNGDEVHHKLIRKEFVGIQPMYAITVEPDHNYVLSSGVVSQNSQIEVRVAAHRSKDKNLMRVYEDEQDVYYDFATTAFKRPDKRFKDGTGWHYPGVDKGEHRRPAKTCVLAAIYDVTNTGLLEQMPVVCKNCNKEATKHDCNRFVSLWNENNCQDLINAFYLRYGGLMSMRKADHRMTLKNGLLWDDWGRILHSTAVYSVLEWVVSTALREAANFPIQSTAQGTVKITMGQFQEDLENGGLLEVAKPLLQIHDEILMEVKNDVAQEIGELLIYRFENCVRLRVPIKASMATANTWGEIAK